MLNLTQLAKDIEESSAALSSVFNSIDTLVSMILTGCSGEISENATNCVKDIQKASKRGHDALWP